MTHLGGQTDGPLLDPATVLKPPNKRIPNRARVLTLPSPCILLCGFDNAVNNGVVVLPSRTDEYRVRASSMFYNVGTISIEDFVGQSIRDFQQHTHKHTANMQILEDETRETVLSKLSPERVCSGISQASHRKHPKDTGVVHFKLAMLGGYSYAQDTRVRRVLGDDEGTDLQLRCGRIPRGHADAPWMCFKKTRGRPVSSVLAGLPRSFFCNPWFHIFSLEMS